MYIWEKNRHILLPYINRRNVFGREHLGPIYGSSHIWAPYMNRRKALTRIFYNGMEVLFQVLIDFEVVLYVKIKPFKKQKTKNKKFKKCRLFHGAFMHFVPVYTIFPVQ
jgi:hypothetical protein